MTNTYENEIKDIRVKITSSTDENFTRTAIQMGDGPESLVSFDILDKDGVHVARLNIFDFDKYYDIDVISMLPGNTRKRIVSYENGSSQKIENAGPVTAILFDKE